MSCTCVALLATAAHAWEASIGADALHAMSFPAEPKGGDVTTVDCISIADGIDDYWCSDLLCEEQPPPAGCPCGDPVQGPTEIERHAQLDMGLRDEDIKALTLAWRQTMGAAQRARLQLRLRPAQR